MVGIGSLLRRRPAVERLGFIVGGVQKAGTTSLFGYLAQHPALAAPADKELHFFDDERIDWTAPDYGRLHRQFGAAARGRMAFEATPITLFWPGALERVRDYNPQIRLIFSFRDPIERAWSHWRMERDRRTEALAFGAAIRRWPSGDMAGASAAEMRDRSYVARGFYGRQLEQALALFPPEQMLLIDSAMLRAAPDAVLGRVASFLGLQPFPPVVPRADNAGSDGGAIPAEDVATLREVYGDDLRRFGDLSGLPVGDWLTLRGR